MFLGCDMNRAALWLIWLACLVSTGATSDLDWSTENKLSYCELISKRRIYRQQRLDDFCLLKVQDVESQVKSSTTP